ncbi:MAG: cysteine desulfurase family protein [bacterium]
MPKPIYLDYAATAPMRPEVITAMKPFWRENFGNPASIHSFGREALNVVDAARRQVAGLLNCQSQEIIFTSGGTESDNLAIQGVARRFPECHIITSAIEHKAVLETCRQLERQGYLVTYIRPNESGVVAAEQVVKAITPRTALVSIIYANNEVGTIQPIREIGLQLKKINQTRKQSIYFHTDAVQAANYLELNTAILHVDLLTVSAHKLGGPKGIGLLFVKDGAPIEPIVYGGGQEQGLRSGTLNAAGIVGLAAALTSAQAQREKETRRLRAWQDRAIKKVGKLRNIHINGSLTDRLPNNINFSVNGKTSDELVIGFDRHGIAVSAASACAAGSIEPSYVLKAMGLSDSIARSSVRITLGYQTANKEINRLIKVLSGLI